LLPANELGCADRSLPLERGEAPAVKSMGGDVVRGQLPGELEQVVLLALAGYEGEATGRDVYESVTAATGRDVSVAAIHITLNRIHDKGWAKCRTTEPAPGEGGKPRRRYSLGPEGARVLAEQRAAFDRLWGRALDHPLLGGERG
jgi:PadR family transcriptional regulator PadR